MLFNWPINVHKSTNPDVLKLLLFESWQNTRDDTIFVSLLLEKSLCLLLASPLSPAPTQPDGNE